AAHGLPGKTCIMPPQHSATLTDTARGIWLGGFLLGPGNIPNPGQAAWAIRKGKLHGGPPDGIGENEGKNGRFFVTVLPTRGMGLWKGSYRNLPLGWKAPISGPVHPKFVNLADRKGLGWLTGFNEWLCRCGLVSNGPPGDDNRTALTLHGRIANIPA